MSVKQKSGHQPDLSPTWNNLTFLWKLWFTAPHMGSERTRHWRYGSDRGGMQPKSRAQGWQAKLGTESRGHVQPLSRNTSAVSELSMEGLSPIAIPRTQILSLEKVCLNIHASGVPAFPFLKNPIIPWRWWTLPSAACRGVGCSARDSDGAPQLSVLPMVCVSIHTRISDVHFGWPALLTEHPTRHLVYEV